MHHKKNVVLLSLMMITTLIFIMTGCGEKEPQVASIESDSCIGCHISADIIDSLYVPPTVEAGGGG
jgi:ABC-type uncharacterized transport system auxiliary subunit